jgi:Zn-dependent protease
MDPIFLFVILALIFSIVIHEVAHGFAADRLGDPTARLQGRLTLNPISHIDPLGSVIIPGLLVLTNAGILFGWAKPVPYNPYNLKNQRWGEAMVAGAGPAVNIVIALVFGLLIRFDVLAAFGGTEMVSLAMYIVYINVLLALFNMIPIPPLDGSKILTAFLPYKGMMAMRRFEAMMAQYGFIGLFLFIFVFIFFLWPIFASVLSWIVFLITGQGGFL